MTSCDTPFSFVFTLFGALSNCIDTGISKMSMFYSFVGRLGEIMRHGGNWTGSISILLSHFLTCWAVPCPVPIHQDKSLLEENWTWMGVKVSRHKLSTFMYFDFLSFLPSCRHMFFLWYVSIVLKCSVGALSIFYLWTLREANAQKLQDVLASWKV